MNSTSPERFMNLPSPLAFIRILANRIGKFDDAYELYLRTSRLDLDDYNREVDEGLHITSMGGTWMSVVLGFGGMRMREEMISFNPNLPKKWKSLSFYINYRGRKLKVSISEKKVNVGLIEGEPLKVEINGNPVQCVQDKK